MIEKNTNFEQIKLQKTADPGKNSLFVIHIQFIKIYGNTIILE